MLSILHLENMSRLTACMSALSGDRTRQLPSRRTWGHSPCRVRAVTCSIAVSGLARRPAVKLSKSVSIASGSYPRARLASKVAGGRI